MATKRKADEGEGSEGVAAGPADSGVKKQKAEGKHPGDWNCPDCEHLNFHFRTQCQRCQAVKSGAEAGAGAGKRSTDRPGDWNCLVCNSHNFATRYNCRKCNAGKPPEGMVAAQAQGGAQGERRAGDWNCPSCGDHNYASRAICRKCHTGKPLAGQGYGAGAGMFNPMAAMAGAMALGGMMPPNPYMGNMGPYGETAVGAAGYPVPGYPNNGAPAGAAGAGRGGGAPANMRPGDWICSGCGDHNYASRYNCRQCNAPKSSEGVSAAYGGGPVGRGPRGGGDRPGDWNCPSCGNHNFATRDVCRQCSTPKPEGAGGVAGGAPPRKTFQDRAGDWSCPGCKKHNFATRDVCRSCFTSKPLTLAAV